MPQASILGLAAGFLTTVATIPQVYKVWKTKSAEDISMKMVILVSAGIFLWLLYGLEINDTPLIVANIFTVALWLSILVMKIIYGKRKS